MDNPPLPIENTPETVSIPLSTWQVPEQMPPPRIKETLVRNVDEGKFVGGMLATFFDALSATVKGVLRQEKND